MTPGSGRILEALDGAARAAIQAALGQDAEPEVRETADPRFGDYQINGVLPLARVLKDNPRKLAERVVAALDLGGMCLPPELAGPGFINLRLDPAWIAAEVGRRAGDPRLGVAPRVPAERIVVDFSSPNVAKRMHVGHLRSTIIGDALVRTLRFLGHEVIGDNHVGDWGTQFGLLIWAYREDANEAALDADPIGELERLYKLGSERAKADPAIREAAKAELVKLQQGDPDNTALWERFVAISRAEAEHLYARLGVRFDAWLGESAYNARLQPLVDELKARGIAEESEGATVIFFHDVPGLEDKPLLIQKSDGGFLYGTTDLATIEHRVKTWQAERMIYVVDVRQSDHFRQLFAAARRLSYSNVDFRHVGFGMMLGADGRPFRTREGGTLSLEALLDEAEARILPKVVEKWPAATEAEQREIAREVGIGAVKFADLSQNLATDYKFDWDKLLAADGFTGPYLQYTLVRLYSVAREYEARFGEAFVPDGAPLHFEAPEEEDLARELLKLGDVLDRVGKTLLPHILCEYLYGLARKINPFYAKCPILRADSDALRKSRMTLVAATTRALEIGFDALNLPRVERM